MSDLTDTLPGIETAEKLGLNVEEYDKICDYLGRKPNFTELSLYSVMWSEHCSYKNSIKYLKTLPRDGENLLVGAGEENAGLVDIGDGLACAFKIESHNHPSAIEPYQGAATGVGGIHRDIFTMGARPIAALNSLRFGEITRKHTQHLMDGVVRGIGDYGNCLGVPTVGGEVYFDPCYNQNILVNAMSVGLVRVGETISAIAEGPGNPVFIVGSATGKDGIHGATFASADLTENSVDDLPAVQVGDPFQEKLLLEASLEVAQTGALVGMQDMGAAGISCSTSEMSAKGAVGMKIYLEKVPTRQSNMQPFEILLSESQERMLIVAKAGREQELLDIFEKWDLECEEIGVVTDSGRLEFYMNSEKVADVPADSLVLGGGAPVYDREFTKPKYFEKIEAYKNEDVAEVKDIKSIARTLASAPNIASKRWIYEQYDHTVRTNNMTTQLKTDAALVRVKGTNKALSVTTDCNSSYVYANPYVGAMIAVSEAARNISCTGATPLAITNCLNFGNPYNPEVYYQFVNAIKGMGEACRKFNTPVTGGNVSFYNQSVQNNETTPVFPTPTIGMVGLLDDIEDAMELSFKEEGDLIYLLGKVSEDMGSSEYIKLVHNIRHSSVPEFDLEDEFLLQNALRGSIKEKLIRSAHDVSEGGLFITLMESAIAGALGFRIETPKHVRRDAFLFGEAQSRIVVSVARESAPQFEKHFESQGVNVLKLGVVSTENFEIDEEDFGGVVDWRQIYLNSIENHLETE